MPNPRDSQAEQATETRAAEADIEAQQSEDAGEHVRAANQAASAAEDWGLLARARQLQAAKLLRPGVPLDGKTRMADAAEAFERAARACERSARNHRAAGNAAAAAAMEAEARRNWREAGLLLEGRAKLLVEQGELYKAGQAVDHAIGCFTGAEDAEAAGRAEALRERLFWFLSAGQVKCGENRIGEKRVGRGAGFTRMAAEAAARDAAERNMRGFIAGLRLNSNLCPQDCRRADIAPGPFTTTICAGPMAPEEHRFGFFGLSWSYWKANALCECEVVVTCTAGQ